MGCDVNDCSRDVPGAFLHSVSDVDWSLAWPDVSHLQGVGVSKSYVAAHRKTQLSNISYCTILCDIVHIVTKCVLMFLIFKDRFKNTQRYRIVGAEMPSSRIKTSWAAIRDGQKNLHMKACESPIHLASRLRFWHIFAIYSVNQSAVRGWTAQTST